MNKTRPAIPPGGCKNPDVSDERKSCPLQCKYNFFESDELTIHTFELKCLDCGWRDTIGYRSEDQDEEDYPDDPSRCPFCELCSLNTGINPCEAEHSDSACDRESMPPNRDVD